MFYVPVSCHSIGPMSDLYMPCFKFFFPKLELQREFLLVFSRKLCDLFSFAVHLFSVNCFYCVCCVVLLACLYLIVAAPNSEKTPFNVALEYPLQQILFCMVYYIPESCVVT